MMIFVFYNIFPARDIKTNCVIMSDSAENAKALLRNVYRGTHLFHELEMNHIESKNLDTVVYFNS